jgi:predicted kinase
MPAAGKSTLAEALSRSLGLPLLARDRIKEQLYETLGTGDLEWSNRLGEAAFALLFDLAAVMVEAGRSVILEANFFRGAAEPQFAALPPHRVAQIHCFAPLELLVQRYTSRRRHHGHHDNEKVELLRKRFEESAHGALSLPGDLIRLDTSRPVDMAAVTDRMRRSL